MKTLPFDLIATLICVEESGSFFHAAKRLGISQAGVSFRMKALQELLGSPLFSLQGKKKVLTVFAQELALQGKIQARSFDRGLEGVIRKYENPKNLCIRIGSPAELFSAVRYRFNFEGTLDHRSMSSSDAMLALNQREIDIALSRIVPDSSELIAKKILISSSVLICHRRNAATNTILRSRAFMLKHPALFYQSDGHLLSDWYQHMGIAFHDIRPKFVSQDWRLLLQLVLDGKGYTILPDYLVPETNELLTHEVAHSVISPIVFYAIYRKDFASEKAFHGLIKGLNRRELE